jgi:Protein of unknown function (DUF3168)
MNAGLSLQKSMRDALLASTPLRALLGGAHVYDELPRGAKPPYVVFNSIETRDWSVADQKAHEHFVELRVATPDESRSAAQAIGDAIEATLDMADLTLADYRLINLRLIFWTVSRNNSAASFGATLRFRAATEPN